MSEGKEGKGGTPNAHVPDTQMGQDDFLPACFRVRRSSGVWEVSKWGEFVMRVEVLPL